jgi:hypothetical protein
MPPGPCPLRCRMTLRGCCCNSLARISRPSSLRQRKSLPWRNPAPRLRAASLRPPTKCAPFGRSTAFESPLHPEGTRRAGRYSRVHCRAITTRCAQRSRPHPGYHLPFGAISSLRPAHERRRLAPDRDAALPLCDLLRSDGRRRRDCRRSPCGAGAGAWRVIDDATANWRHFLNQVCSRKNQSYAHLVRFDWRRQTDVIQETFIVARLFTDLGGKSCFRGGHIHDQVKRRALDTPGGLKRFSILGFTILASNRDVMEEIRATPGCTDNSPCAGRIERPFLITCDAYSRN